MEKKQTDIYIKELKEQVLHQHALIERLLDRLENNDPYYKNFIKNEEVLKIYKTKYLHN